MQSLQLVACFVDLQNWDYQFKLRRNYVLANALQVTSQGRFDSRELDWCP